MREGNLEAPPATPIDWKNPEFYDEACEKPRWSASSTSATAAAAASACAMPSQLLFDLVDEAGDLETGRRAQGGLLEGRRPVLPVRRLLHDQVPVRAAAPVEPGFPAHHAARQGDPVQDKGKMKFRDKLLTSTDWSAPCRRFPWWRRR
jgi:hypothetical protein